MAIPGRLRSIIAFLALAALVAGFLLAAPNKAEAQSNSGVTFYAFQSHSNVYTVDTSDGSVTDTTFNVGAYTYPVGGAVSVGDTIYLGRFPQGGGTQPATIFTWDPTTGAATSYLDVSAHINRIVALAADGEVLYAFQNAKVIKIDTARNPPVVTEVCSNYTDGAPSEINSTGVIAAATIIGGVLYVQARDFLWTMDKSDCTFTKIGSNGFGSYTTVSSMTSYNGILYGTRHDSTSTFSLYRISTTSGAATLLGIMTGGITALTVYPGFQGPDCTATLAPAAHLGTLGNFPGSTIVHSSTMVRDVSKIPCGDEGTEYFRFTLTEGGGVGFNTDGLGVTYHILASTAYDADLADCGGGPDTCENDVRGDFGGVFEVTGNSTTYMGFIEGGFGDETNYTLTITRLVPQFVEALTTADSIVSTWDVGAPSEFLEMRVDHRRQKAADWTTGTDYASPTAGDQVVENTIKDLVLDDYALRGVFRHAPDSQGGEGLASTFPQVWGFPPGNMAIEAERVGDLDVYRYSVIATWQFPQVRFTDWDDEEVDWSFLLRYNDTEIDVGQTRRAVFFVDEPGGLKVDVRARFACPESTTDTDECQLRVRGWVSSYAGDEDHDYFALPDGVTVLTPRSDAASVYIDPDPRVVETELVDQEAIPPVVDAISGFLAIAGVAPESRRPEVWAFLVCLVAGIAIGGGLGLATTAAGHTTAALFAGAFAFFLWWSLLGPEWFGIPPFFAYGTVAAPILATGIFIVARARL